jgi:iron(III) transport system ATP-binding protein
MTAIGLESVTRRLGPALAVDDCSLAISAGELFFVLGPSGCGKTTLLRLIAGFVAPDAGRVLFAGRDVTREPPDRRNTGMVFQSYALWPHMTVMDNVMYGLKMRRVPAAERRVRAAEVMAALHIEGLGDRRPGELSGGEQQRVALARALVVKPQVLLLDEPLSNLDPGLRGELRLEIRRICRGTGITTIYVTHDQKEALSMADRVAVMRTGRVVQVAPPRDLYSRPAGRFVAGFVGEANFIDGTVVEARDGRIRLTTGAGHLLACAGAPALGNLPAGTPVTCCVRPESVRLSRHDQADNVLRGRLVESAFLGDATQRHFILRDGTMLVSTSMDHGDIGDSERDIFISQHDTTVIQ